MRLRTFMAVLGAAALGIGLVAAGPAFAQAKRDGASELSSQTASGKKKTRTRVVVRQRSYLDAGTEVLPGERKFNDYAIPPNYSVLESVLGPGQNYWRQPLNNPWDIP